MWDPCNPYIAWGLAQSWSRSLRLAVSFLLIDEALNCELLAIESLAEERIRKPKIKAALRLNMEEIRLWNRGHLGDCIIMLNLARRLLEQHRHLSARLFCRSPEYFYELKLLAGPVVDRISMEAWLSLSHGPYGAVDCWIGRDNYLFEHASCGDYTQMYFDLFNEIVIPQLNLSSPIRTKSDLLFQIKEPTAQQFDFDWLIINAIPYSRQWSYSEAEFEYVVSKLLDRGDTIVATHPLRRLPQVPSTWGARLPLRTVAELACRCRRILGVNTSPMHVAVNTASMKYLETVYSMDNRHFFSYDTRFHLCSTPEELISLLLEHGRIGDVSAHKPLLPSSIGPASGPGRTNTTSLTRLRSPTRTETTIRPTIWCHLDDDRNIGDQMCCPLDHLSLPGVRFDLRQPIDAFAALRPAAVVFGGGGLFHGERLPTKIGQIAAVVRRQSPTTVLVAWGAGANQHGVNEFSYPEYLHEFDLVGLRDWGNPWNYVPCVSCLHSSFDVQWPTPQHDIVAVEHFDHPMTGLPQIPSITNAQDRRRFRDVIAHIANGEALLTNSYHAAYWGLLLGRKVAIYRAFSNRFRGFSRPIPLCDETNWRQAVKSASTYKEYLEECRRHNRAFARRFASYVF